MLRRLVEYGQYTAIRYAVRLANAGALASIGTISRSYDIAMAESVVGFHKNECVEIHSPFRTIDELEVATRSWMNWFIQDRLHSSIGCLTPIKMTLQNREMDPPAATVTGRTHPPLNPGEIH